MKLYNRVTFRNIDYYFEYECCYKKKEHGTELCLKNNKDDDYDADDLDSLLDNLEKYYDPDLVRKKYNIGDVPFLADALYIYDYLPIINGIHTIYTTKNNKISSFNYISKEELDSLIEEHGIKMKDNHDFKLYSAWHFENPFIDCNK